MPDFREYEVWAKLRLHSRRIAHARHVLERASEKGRLAISTSWGKDSVAMCDLAIETLGRVDLMHIAYPDELPGYDRILEWFSARATIHTVALAQSWDEYLAWYLSTESTTQTQRKGARADTWMLRQGFAGYAMGIRADENQMRRRVLLRIGQLYHRKCGLWACYPIGWWSVEDVWARIITRKIPYHPMYDMETHGQDRKKIRNAGWLSSRGPMSTWLKHHYPERFKRACAVMPWLIQNG